MQSTILRAQLESVLDGRVATPFTNLDKCVRISVPSGIEAFDTRTGGLPRGAVTEIFGPPSSGKTSILLSILAAATSRSEVCAIVDSSDSFSPASGTNSGVDLQRLLWVRCHSIDQTLKVADLLLQGGGFGVVAIDVSDLPAAALHSVPLATWFRFQRAIEKTPTILAIVSQDGVAKTCAALALRVSAEKPSSVAHCITHYYGGLFESAAVNVEIVRSRRCSPTESYVCFDLYSAFSRPGARP